MRKCAKEWRWSRYRVKEKQPPLFRDAQSRFTPWPSWFYPNRVWPRHNKVKTQPQHDCCSIKQTSTTFDFKESSTASNASTFLPPNPLSLFQNNACFFTPACVCVSAPLQLTGAGHAGASGLRKQLHRLLSAGHAVWREAGFCLIDRLQHRAQSRYGWLQKHASLKILPLN